MTRAGLWLAPAIAAKPPLALVALALPWPITASAGIAAATGTVMIAVVTGLEPWIAWLDQSSKVDWLAAPANASLWGFVARWQAGGLSNGVSLSNLHPSVLLGSLLVIAGAWRIAFTEPSRDRRFFFAILWSLLASPLGWIYYLPLSFQAAVASWPRTNLAWTACALAMIPFGNRETFDPWMQPCFFAVIPCAWLAWTRSQKAWSADVTISS
jgi:hypothetical protein